MIQKRAGSFGSDSPARESSSSSKTALKRNTSRELAPLKRNSSREIPPGDLISTVSLDGSSHHSRNKAVPGRPRRRKTDGTPTGTTRRSGRKRSFFYRFYRRWIYNPLNSFSSLFIAVILWYSLGVISIGTSKLLMLKGQDGTGGVPPLFLTLQQLVIGSSLLRCLLQIRFMGSSGLQAWPSASGTSTDSTQMRDRQQRYSSRSQTSIFELPTSLNPNLLMAGVYFSFGFLATNYGFSSSSASFVETIKAAEPITSASVAVWWGIEVLSRQETASLGVIVAGVLLSTFGNSHGNSGSTNVSSTFSESVTACCIVMAANLCFSFRGLYQKLFRATTEGSTQVVDDINLQFRMQQIGACMLVIPALLFESSTVMRLLWKASTEHGMIPIGVIWEYIALALVNACAFAAYNLASTFILSRISVVHHAALNCLRRIFAIIVTSVAFAVPITLLGAFGIIVSVVGFLSFTHYKLQRQRQPKPLSSLLPVSAAPNGKAYS